MIFPLQELSMKILATAFILLCAAFAQNAAPANNRVEWNSSAAGALKELPDGRIQRTAMSNAAAVSAIADVTAARRFVDPPADGGGDVTYIVIGIQNRSQQTVHIDPSSISLRVVGKKERDLKRFSEEQVIARAWQANDRSIGAIPPMVGAMGARGGAESSQQAAITHRELGNSDRRIQQASEQQTGVQVAKLRERALIARDLESGGQVMGMVFFYPYEKKDHLELVVPVGDTTFVFPFSGKKR
jgi:hypothetical protein